MLIDVSIILPVYNGARFLEMTLDSLIAQSYENCEIIAINDGSTDESLEILNKYAHFDKRIVIISTQNQGICTARNIGIQTAKGKYIMFCDHDDTYNPEYVEKAYAAIVKGDYDYVKFSCKEIYLRGGVVTKTNNILIGDNRFSADKSLHILYEYTKYHEYIWDGIYKKELIEEVEGFDVRFTAGNEDVDLFLKLAGSACSCATNSWVAYNHYIRRESSTSQRYSENSYYAFIEMYTRKMDMVDHSDKRCREYCRSKTRDCLYVVMAFFANKTCFLPFSEVYYRMASLSDYHQFSCYIKDVHFNPFVLKCYPALAYRCHCYFLLALICMGRRIMHR